MVLKVFNLSGEELHKLEAIKKFLEMTKDIDVLRYFLNSYETDDLSLEKQMCKSQIEILQKRIESMQNKYEKLEEIEEFIQIKKEIKSRKKQELAKQIAQTDLEFPNLSKEEREQKMRKSSSILEVPWKDIEKNLQHLRDTPQCL